jgi:hypothetical protein
VGLRDQSGSLLFFKPGIVHQRKPAAWQFQVVYHGSSRQQADRRTPHCANSGRLFNEDMTVGSGQICQVAV